MQQKEDSLISPETLARLAFPRFFNYCVHYKGDARFHLDAHRWMEAQITNYFPHIPQHFNAQYLMALFITIPRNGLRSLPAYFHQINIAFTQCLVHKYDVRNSASYYVLSNHEVPCFSDMQEFYQYLKKAHHYIVIQTDDLPSHMVTTTSAEGKVHTTTFTTNMITKVAP